MKLSDKVCKLPLYYINMDDRPDRNEAILEQLEQVQWEGPVKRIPGVRLDVESAEFKEFRLERLQSSIQNFKKYAHPKYFPWWASLIGCTLAHLRVVSRAFQDNYNAYVVLEDDAVFRPDFRETEDWGDLNPELILFGNNGILNPNRFARSSKGWIPAMEMWGTHAYALLTQNAIDRVSDVWRQMDATTDVGWWKLFESLNALTHKPPLISPSGSPSSIEVHKNV